MAEPEWELWYQDTFDRECPRQMEHTGRGLEQGLRLLWTRYLRETVGADGQRGFSYFSLWLTSERRTIHVTGTWQGAVRLRKWIFEVPAHPGGSGNRPRDTELLQKVVAAHARLVRAGQRSDAILAVAAAATSRAAFERWLDEFVFNDG